MATYILPEELHGETHYTLVMGSGFANAIDGLSRDLLNISGIQDKKADLVMAIMACSRHLATTLQEAADQLDGLSPEELPGEEEA